MPRKHPLVGRFPPEQPIDQAAYWLGRAEEIQTLAESLGNPHARLMMLELAETYKKMAERANSRARDN
jgi:hypothetical protein